MNRNAEVIWTEVTAKGWARIKKEAEKALNAAIKSGEGAMNLRLKPNGEMGAKFVKSVKKKPRRGKNGR